MRRVSRSAAACLVLVVLALAPWVRTLAQGDREDPRPPQRPLTREECDRWVGLAPEQLRHHLGPPRTINRQILSHRYLEQWLYDSPYFVRAEIDCTRGRKPHILTVQPLQSGKP